MIRDLKNSVGIYYIIPIMSLIFVLVLQVLGVFNYLELKSIDMRFKIRGEISVDHSDIIIVAIDEQSYGSLREKFPYPRSYYGKVVENLTNAGARQIIFDIEFTKDDQGYEEHDSIFAACIKKAGNVILAGTIIRNIERNYNYYQPPTEKIRKNTLANGLVNDIHDEDGFVRKYNIFVPCQQKDYYTIGTLSYLISEGLDPGQIKFYREKKNCVILDSLSEESLNILTNSRGFWQEQSFRINFYGPAGTFPYYSFSQVLDDAGFDLIDDWDNDYMEIWKPNSIFPNILRINFLNEENQKEAERVIDDSQKVEAVIQKENPFRNKIIFVGSSLPELHDERYMPFYHYNNENRLMPGVEIHAHALQTMMDENYLKNTPVFINFLMLLLLNYILVFSVKILRPFKGAVLVVATILLSVIISSVLFSQFNLILPLITLMFSMVINYIAVVGVEFFNEEKEKRKIRKMFQTYTSAKVLKYLEENPDSFSLKGERREATILFSDIAGFTTISEKLSAEELSSLLNRYLTPMTQIMMKYDGYVDKYQGDGIMCNFGVPILDKDHAWKACFSALEQLETLDKLRIELREEYGFDINIRIGINTGILSAGNMGSAERFQYSVIGDVVNQAARFESANKQYKTRIMIGEETYKKSIDKIEARLLDKIVVKGKEKPVKVYNLIGKKGAVSDELLKFVSYYNSGMDDYFSRNWSGAIDNFQKSMEIEGDYASQLMICRSEEYMKNPPSQNWQGEFTLKSK